MEVSRFCPFEGGRASLAARIQLRGLRALRGFLDLALLEIELPLSSEFEPGERVYLRVGASSGEPRRTRRTRREAFVNVAG